MNARVDHLVYATPDVDRTVEGLAKYLGVGAAIGGRHEGRGTRNALIALGPRSYLEIIGPDHSQPAPIQPRWFGIDALDRPRLATWAANAAGLHALAAPGSKAAALLGPVVSGSRTRPDGVILRWTLTDPIMAPGAGIVPFLIDWGSSPHPAESAPQGVTLVGLRGEHPDARSVRDVLRTLDLDLVVTTSVTLALIAVLSTPKGTIELS